MPRRRPRRHCERSRRLTRWTNAAHSVKLTAGEFSGSSLNLDILVILPVWVHEYCGAGPRSRCWRPKTLGWCLRTVFPQGGRQGISGYPRRSEGGLDSSGARVQCGHPYRLVYRHAMAGQGSAGNGKRNGPYLRLPLAPYVQGCGRRRGSNIARRVRLPDK
jgi:hypothetical protein